MAQVLTTASSVTCTHTGKVGTSSAAKLMVQNASVLLASSIAGKAIAGCIVVDDPNTLTKRCTTAAAVAGGLATKLKVGGAPVALDTLTGSTDGTPPPVGQPLGAATANQTKLRAS